jgi:hypothetical protein
MEQLRILVAALLLWTTGTAVLVTLIGFFPRFAIQAQAVIEQSPGRALVVGLVNFFFLGILTLTFFALGENVAQIFAIPGLILTGIGAAGVLLGTTGAILLLGQRLWSDRSAVRRHTYAAALLLLACLAPAVGWFLLLPSLLIVALGACVMVLFGRLQQGRPLPGEETNLPT